jgi:hypothetical protein
MQSDAWNAFASDTRAVDRTPEVVTEAEGDAFAAWKVTPPVCIECLARTMRRSTGDVVDEVMALYARFKVALSEVGHCRCSRRTVVVE